MTESIWLGASRGESPPSEAAAPASLHVAVKAAIGNEIPRHAARHLGEEEARVLAAFDLLILATLRRFARRIVSTEGAARLFGDLGSRHLDDRLSAALDPLTADEPHDPPFARGEETARRHFGRSTGRVAFTVAAETGLRPETLRTLLPLVTLLVLAGLRDYMKAGDLDGNALRQRLADEYPPALTMPRLRRAFVLGSLLLALAAAAALAWRSAPRDAPAPLERSAPGGNAIPQASRSPAVGALVEYLSSDEAPGDQVVALDGVRFEPGSATLDPVSNAQLRELATVLERYPKARTTLTVQTDDASEEALEMAKQRAAAVRAALAVFGVPLARTYHAGVGAAEVPGHPVEARVSKP
jgi:outer membrane protein OmpA-like peptidoglycan-associated protein